MAFLTTQEIFDIIVMTAALGYIFADVFSKYAHKKNEEHDPLKHYKKISSGYDWESFKFACYVTAPAIIFHELGHKITALGLGLNATFHAAYSWLGLGIVLKLLNTGFIFFVPAYVSHSGYATPIESAMIAFAGPFINLILWITSWIILKNNLCNKKHIAFFHLTKYINMILFFFNMIPIFGFDGQHVLSGITRTFT
jgi:Zn-dependent protease